MSDLDRLRAAITPKTWCQDVPRFGAHKRCLVTHIEQLGLTNSRADESLRRAAAARFGTRSLIAFNDLYAQSVDDIHTLIEEAKAYV